MRQQQQAATHRLSLTLFPTVIQRMNAWRWWSTKCSFHWPASPKINVWWYARQRQPLSLDAGTTAFVSNISDLGTATCDLDFDIPDDTRPRVTSSMVQDGYSLAHKMAAMAASGPLTSGFLGAADVDVPVLPAAAETP